MMHDQLNDALRPLALDRYMNEARFRAIVQSVAGYVCAQRMPLCRDHPEEAAHELALEVASLLFERHIQGDAELLALRAERDAYKRMAETALINSPLPPAFIRSGPLVSVITGGLADETSPPDRA